MKVHFKNVALSIVSAVAAAFTVSCSAGKFDIEMNVGRTLLIYLAADNNLASYAERNIQEIMEGDVPYYFNEGAGDVLLVYADIRGENPRLMRISKDAYDVVNQEVLVEYEPHNSLSDSVMRDVLSYAARLFPSSEHSLILWSHGTGWLPEGYYSNPYSTGADGAAVPLSMQEDPFASYVKSFGQDSPAGAEMDIKTLAEVLPVHYRYIMFDACLMGGVEVAYELRNSCDYMIASAAEVLASGFPYKSILGDLIDGSLSSLRSVCDKYYNNYIESGATVALVDAGKMEQLATACREVLRNGGLDSIPGLDMDSLQGYFRLGRHWFYDLGDLMDRIAPDETWLDNFESAMNEAVVYKRSTDAFVLGGYEQFAIKTFSGLSTYVPNPENPVLDEYYRTLAWNQAVQMIR